MARHSGIEVATGRGRKRGGGDVEICYFAQEAKPR